MLRISSKRNLIALLPPDKPAPKSVRNWGRYYCTDKDIYFDMERLWEGDHIKYFTKQHLYDAIDKISKCKPSKEILILDSVH